MNDIAKSLFAFAWEFASNEDEFGIFLSGVIAGGTLGIGGDEMKAVDIGEEMVKMGPQGALNSGEFFFNSFLSGKRHVERKNAESPFQVIVRRKIVSILYTAAEKRGK